MGERLAAALPREDAAAGAFFASMRSAPAAATPVSGTTGPASGATGPASGATALVPWDRCGAAGEEVWGGAAVLELSCGTRGWLGKPNFSKLTRHTGPQPSHQERNPFVRKSDRLPRRHRGADHLHRPATGAHPRADAQGQG